MTGINGDPSAGPGRSQKGDRLCKRTERTAGPAHISDRMTRFRATDVGALLPLLRFEGANT